MGNEHGKSFDLPKIPESVRSRAFTFAPPVEHPVAPGSPDAKRNLVSSEEKELLKYIFNLLFRKDDEAVVPDSASIAALSGPDNRVIIDKAILAYWAANNINTFRSFGFFIIDCTKVPEEETLALVWKIIDYLPIEESKFSSKLQRFCALLMALSANNAAWSEDTESLLTSAAQLAEWYNTASHMKDSTTNLDDNLPALYSVLHEFSPYAIKAFQSYMAGLFLHVPHSNLDFRSAWLLKESVILQPSMVGFLSMYCDEMQAEWKQLYTTSSDGTTMSMLAHHIIGYDVRKHNILLKLVRSPLTLPFMYF